jgi:ankyrin repeat protein
MSRPGRTVIELLKAGANIEARDEDGLTPWLVAAASGAKDVAIALVANDGDKRDYPKSDVMATDPMSMNALHFVALGGHTELLKMLSGPGWGSARRDTEPRWLPMGGLPPPT